MALLKTRARAPEVARKVTTTSPAVVDWDKDGRPEILIGAEDGFFYYLRRP
ncbi:MAG: hypothetical protein R3F11_14390 [Verrucomicrobiales bacterium]